MINLKKGWLLFVSCSSLFGINRSYKSVKLSDDVTVVLNLSEHHPDDRDMIEAYGKEIYRPSTDGFGLLYANRPAYVKTEHDQKAQEIEKLMTDIKEELHCVYCEREIAPAKKAQLASLIDRKFIMTESDRQDPVMLAKMKQGLGLGERAMLEGLVGALSGILAVAVVSIPFLGRK